MERELIVERTKSGMAAAKRRGRRIGRPWAVRGSDAFTLERHLRSGMSLRTIAREMGISVPTVLAAKKRLGLNAGE